MNHDLFSVEKDWADKGGSQQAWTLVANGASAGFSPAAIQIGLFFHDFTQQKRGSAVESELTLLSPCCHARYQGAWMPQASRDLLRAKGATTLTREALDGYRATNDTTQVALHYCGSCWKIRFFSDSFIPRTYLVWKDYGQIINMERSRSERHATLQEWLELTTVDPLSAQLFVQECEQAIDAVVETFVAEFLPLAEEQGQ